MEARKKVARLVLSFVIVFAICWFPRHIYSLWYTYDPGEYDMFWHVFKIIGFCLAFINSCVNPLALYFLSRQFRRYYDRYLFRCCRRYPSLVEDTPLAGSSRRDFCGGGGNNCSQTPNIPIYLAARQHQMQQTRKTSVPMTALTIHSVC